MKKIREQRSETVFADFKKAYDQHQAIVEANRCLYCEDAPCAIACPTHIDIPQFIRKIATGNLWGSARTIFASNVLGMSCARVCPVEVLCVGDCVYNEMGAAPIEIGKLQRYATDVAFAEGWSYFEAGADTGRSVGLVGGGPASIAAAHELRRHGHACTIYEARDVLGGLNTTGVAPYKIRADKVAEEIDWVLSIGGVRIETGVSIGEDLSWEELEARHDAIFIGVGLGADSRMGIEGEDLPGVEGAVAFIERLKLDEVSVEGVEHAIVVGGGNTAIDAVRELGGLGVPDVKMMYRGDASGMSGYEHEWKAALVEGAFAAWHAIPVAYEGDGRVERVRAVRTDASKRPIEGSEQEVPADLVLLAIGQARGLVAGLEGVEVDGRGRILTDEEGATGRPGLYAGGDCVNGGKEVVNAVAEGKAAAGAIDRYLNAAKGA